MSTVTSPLDSVVTSVAAPARKSRLSLYLDLTKARLSAMVVMTTLVGAIVASPASVDWIILFWTVLGTALAAGSANALNQVFESDRDRRMERTSERPIVSGQLSSRHALTVAVAGGAVGTIVLATMVNLLAAGLALATLLLYVLVYTPLKTRSSLNTLVGAVCGALPPLIGWAAATGRLELAALFPAALLFVWQIPHFLALAWMYREDYARGGFVMLPVIDPSGAITCRVILLTSLLLVPLGLLAALMNLAGVLYVVGSAVLGLWMVFVAARLYRNRTEANARKLFLTSIMYLPLLMCLLVIDRGPIG